MKKLLQSIKLEIDNKKVYYEDIVDLIRLIESFQPKKIIIRTENYELSNIEELTNFQEYEIININIAREYEELAEIEICIKKNRLFISTYKGTLENKTIINEIETFFKKLKWDYISILRRKSHYFVICIILVLGILGILFKDQEQIVKSLYYIAMVTMLTYTLIINIGGVLLDNLFIPKLKIIKQTKGSFYQRHKEIINTLITIIATAYITWFFTK